MNYGNFVLSPMPGTLISFAVKEGDIVELKWQTAKKFNWFALASERREQRLLYKFELCYAHTLPVDLLWEQRALKMFSNMNI